MPPLTRLKWGPRGVVLNDKAAMVPLVLDRQYGETQLWVKEVRVGKGKAAQRYIVTVNEAEAKKHREDRRGRRLGVEHRSGAIEVCWVTSLI